MKRTSLALYLLYLLMTQGSFCKQHVLQHYDVAPRTFARAVAEIRYALLDFCIDRELVYDKLSGSYRLLRLDL